MPRTGGVYAPPAGTKGVSNTTIQSVPYNAFIDDLTADANAARPVTAGGTGSTTASGARAALGADNASNLTSGTVADARLPTSQAGKTWTSFSNFNAAGIVAASDAVTNTNYWSWRPTDYGVGKPALNIRKTTTATVWQIELFDTATSAGTLNIQCATFTLNGNTIWNSANDGAGSGLDADLLDGQQGSFYQNAANLTGTIADARLPTSMAGKTFTSLVDIRSTAPILQFTETDNSNKTWLIVADGNTWSVRENDTATTRLRLDPDGSLTGFTYLGQVIWTAGNDGAASGLDADLLDGQQGSFYQNLANATGTLADARLPGTMSSKTFTGNIHMTGPNGSIEVGAVGASNTPSIDFHSSASSTDFDARLIASGGTAASGAGNLDVISAAFTKGGNTIWHAGNDGAASGLDADLLDGQQGAYYADIPSRLGFTPVQQGGGAGQGTNKVYVGWSASGLKAQVDVTDLGKIWTDSLAGGAPSSGWVKFPNGLILQSGSTVVTTNASADGSISFPSAFPTSCTSVVGVGGDVTVPSTDLKIGGLTTTAFNFRAPGAASQPVRVNWIAWGY